MSYDLMLEGGDIPSFAEIAANTPHVQVEGEGGWLYVNDGTGVYFAMNVDQVLDEEALANGVSDEPYIDCAINYLRPSFFVDESVPVILGLATSLGWTVRDPQIDDVAQAPDAVDPATIREHWQGVTRAWVRKPDAMMPRMEPSDSSSMWRYNVSRPEPTDDDLFLPTLLPFRRLTDPDRALRGIVWGEGIGMLFPPADVVAIGTQRRLGPVKVGNPTFKYVSYDAFVGALGGLVCPQDDLLRLSIDDAQHAVERVRKLDSLGSESYERLGFDGFVDVY